LVGLRTTAVEDKPLEGDVVLVDVFGDAADDLRGWLEEAFAAAAEGQQASAHPVDLERARRSLTICQGRFNRISQRFSSDLVHYERMAELTRFGRTRGGEWRAWATGVKEALDSCRQPLFDTGETLFRCWQELAERAEITSISVQATNIGQQLYKEDRSNAAR
jgi:hypothetical protein